MLLVNVKWRGCFLFEGLQYIISATLWYLSAWYEHMTQTRPVCKSFLETIRSFEPNDTTSQ